ncbi:MAG: sensor histidine kinase [Lysinibacillus sp.]
MLVLFFKERLSWIVFYSGMLMVLNVLLRLDSGLAGISIMYVNVILGISFITFLLYRYIVETKQLKNFLGNLDVQLDEVHCSSLMLSPYQHKYFTKIEDVLREKDATLNEVKVQLQEDVDDLLAWVHEVKAPLTSMNLMLTQVEDDTLRRRLEYEWLRIHLLVDQQLHQTRFASIEKDNYMTEIVLRTVVYEEIRAMQSWCLGKNIGFDVADLKDTVMTDGKWLAFIIRQLLSNAIKYSATNTEITVLSEVDHSGATILHIKDNGVGIRREDLPRIFQKSYTGTVGRESAQSTGMGLYLAHNVAKKLGIHISVQSTVGEGSIFMLRFPLQNEYVKIKGR